MLRTTLLSLADSKSAKSFIAGFPGSRSVVSRFVAGEHVDDALRVIADLATRGIHVTVDHLGEHVTTEREASAAADAYLRLVDSIAAAGLKSHVSLKLTQFGLDLGEAACASQLRRVLDRARVLGTFVRVDMEDSAHTDPILGVVRAMKAAGYDNVGVVIQAYLRRSEHDVETLCAEGIRVRLCKGAYREPPDRAYPDKKDVDAAYVRLSEVLLRAAKSAPALYPALATHDVRMIEAAKTFAAQSAVPASAFEFQMLYGIRRDLQDGLSRQGFNMRVYVPFGAEWYPYFLRRLAERPANLWFFASNVFKG